MKSLVRNHKSIVSVLLALLISICTYFTGYADITPVSDRTPQVRDAIVAAVPGVNSAADVTEEHLANIRTLSLYRKNITALKEGDFDGLSSLRSLNLHRNSLSSLPAGIFTGLTSLKGIALAWNQLNSLPAGIFTGLTTLETINISRNQLSSLPAGIFTGLTSLTAIDLTGHQLNSLPAGIFTGLTSLTTLSLGGNQLSSLPAGIFTGLTSLTTLSLGGNQLSSLPAGIFTGLTSLTTLSLGSSQLSSIPAGIFTGLTSLTHLTLSGNSTGSLPNGIFSGLTSLTNLSFRNNANIDAALTVLLQDIGGNQFKVVVPTGAPFTIVVPLNVTNGSVMGGATTATIPIGSVESAPFTLIPTPGASDDPTVLIGILPDPPSEHSRYTLAHFNLAPEFVEGQNTTRTVSEDIHTGGYIGTAVTAIDPHNDALTYSLSGADASSFAIDPTTGQLKTNIKLDYETRTLYTVTVNVTDGTLTASITVNISVSDVEPEMRNVGIPRTVRLFYLLPNDKLYRAEVLEAMKSGILEIQAFFREQMEAHGHGSKTFEIETDDQGDPIVHRVDGDYPESEYQGRTKGEIIKAYDNSQNVILIVVDVGTGGGAHGFGVSGKSSGWAMIYGGWHWAAAAHELGHAFGLHHDFRDTAYIMGYSRPTRSTAQLSAGAAEFLAVSPYFNSDIPLKNESPPTLELLSPKFYRHNAKSVPIRLRVRDADGLYQVMLLVSTKRILGASGSEVKEFRKLASETDTIIEFNYDGITPSDRTYSSPPYTSLADPLQHHIGFLFTDMLGNNEGNVIYPRFVFEGKIINTDLPVSQRTPQVRDAIVAAVPGVSNANDVTKTHLATITNLDLKRKYITSLKSGDFHGLTGLTTLDLSGNYFSVLPFGIFNDNTKLTSLSLNASLDTLYGTIDNLTNLTELHLTTNGLPSGILDNLTNLTELRLSTPTLSSDIFDNLTNLTELHLTTNSLPSGILDNLTNLTELRLSTPTLSSDIFDNLTNLTELYLKNNDLTSLPSGIFDDLTALKTLNLEYNDLTSLPSGIFDDLTALTELYLNDNDLTSLPSGIFDDLTALKTLHLAGNDLSSLPDGIFKGLTQLNLLYLGRNRHYLMPLPVSLEKVRKDQVKAVAPTGAPFKIVLPLTVKNGSVSGGASSTTIPIGSVESGTLTVVRTPGTTAAVTVDIGTLPRTPLNSGYTLVKSDDFPLEFTGIDVAANNAPVFTDGTSTTRSIAENTAANTNIGTAIAATDADSGDTLTYTLSGTDAASFSIVSTTGQLQTKAALDYETEPIYTLTITVSDGVLTDTITVTIYIRDINDTAPVSTLTPVSQRTPQVRDAIVAAVPGVNAAADVTEAHLAAITSLSWNYLNNRTGITSLKSGDFDGLTALTSLQLSYNNLTTLPPRIFDELTALTNLQLSNNDLTALPFGIFDELTALKTLNLRNNDLTSLPPAIFDELTALTNLQLSNNDLTALPFGIFDELTALTWLSLDGNALTTLPAGVFDELTALTRLGLYGNAFTTLPAGVFDELTALKVLNLYGNAFTTLPVGVF